RTLAALLRTLAALCAVTFLTKSKRAGKPSIMTKPASEPPAEDAPEAQPQAAIDPPAESLPVAHGSSWRERLRRVGAGLGPRRAEALFIWASRACVLAVLFSYVASWVTANQGMLFDPDLQNDDARTILFPFHHYGSQG